MPFGFGKSNRRGRQSEPKPYNPADLAPAYDGPAGPPYAQTQPAPITNLAREETSSRFILTIFTSCCLVLAFLFLIIVEIGNTENKVALRHIWFIKLKFTNIPLIANDTPGLGYSLAESLNLYDFYQVGLWNYCEGNNGTGVEKCKATDARYWFNPLDILTDQLDGTFTLPRGYDHDIHIVKVASHWMFGLFMTGAVLSFVLTPIVLIGMRSRWYSAILAIITFVNAVCVFAATVIATALFVTLRRVFNTYVEIINLVPTLGSTMFAMMWLASLFAIGAFCVQAVLSCCFTSKRDLRRARQKSFI